jgi:hypothetical protein
MRKWTLRQKWNEELTCGASGRHSFTDCRISTRSSLCLDFQVCGVIQVLRDILTGEDFHEMVDGVVAFPVPPMHLLQLLRAGGQRDPGHL